MRLQLYLHPLASYCQKALIAFYENEVPFEPIVIDLGDRKGHGYEARPWVARTFAEAKPYLKFFPG